MPLWEATDHPYNVKSSEKYLGETTITKSQRKKKTLCGKMIQNIKAFSVMLNDLSLNSGERTSLQVAFFISICIPLHVQTHAKGKNE